MADQSDVEDALARAVAGALYPHGTDAPSALGRVARVFRGWPQAAALDEDLAKGRVLATIFPDPHHQRTTTRWAEEWVALGTVVPALSLTVEPAAALIEGAVQEGLLVGLQADTLSVVHRTRAADTPEMIAAALAARLRALGRVAHATGARVRVPGAGLVVGRVVAEQPGLVELRRQSQRFRISLWCPDAASRDAAGALVDGVLAAIRFLPLADGGAARLGFVSSALFDQSVNARLWRRDLIYAAEYATTRAERLPEMVFGVSAISAQGRPVGETLS